MKDIVIRLHTLQDMQIKFNINQVVGFEASETGAFIEVAYNEKTYFGTEHSINIPVDMKTLNGIREIMGLSCIG